MSDDQEIEEEIEWGEEGSESDLEEVIGEWPSLSSMAADDDNTDGAEEEKFLGENESELESCDILQELGNLGGVLARTRLEDALRFQQELMHEDAYSEDSSELGLAESPAPSSKAVPQSATASHAASIFLDNNSGARVGIAEAPAAGGASAAAMPLAGGSSHSEPPASSSPSVPPLGAVSSGQPSLVPASLPSGRRPPGAVTARSSSNASAGLAAQALVSLKSAGADEKRRDAAARRGTPPVGGGSSVKRTPTSALQGKRPHGSAGAGTPRAQAVGPASAPTPAPPLAPLQPQQQALSGTGGGPLPVLPSIPPPPATSARAPMPGLRLVRGLAAEVLCVAPVGKDVWTGEREGGIAIRNLLTGEVKDTVTREYQFLVLCMRTVADHVWAGTEAGVILVFEGRTKALKYELRGHSGAVRSLTVGQPSGTSLPHVWSAGSDFSVCEWDAVRFKAVRSLRHTGGVRALALVGGLLWTGSDDNCVRVWSGAVVQATLRAHTGAITSLLASQSGASVLSASEDGTLRRWAVRAPFEENGSPASTGSPISSLVAVGSHLWVSGPNKVIVFHDASDKLVALREFKAGHAISRVSVKESRVVWTSSILDKSIKIWKKTTTHEGAQESQVVAELLRKLQDVCRERDELRSLLERANDGV